VTIASGPMRFMYIEAGMRGAVAWGWPRGMCAGASGWRSSDAAKGGLEA